MASPAGLLHDSPAFKGGGLPLYMLLCGHACPSVANRLLHCIGHCRLQLHAVPAHAQPTIHTCHDEKAAVWASELIKHMECLYSCWPGSPPSMTPHSHRTAPHLNLSNCSTRWRGHGRHNSVAECQRDPWPCLPCDGRQVTPGVTPLSCCCCTQHLRVATECFLPAVCRHLHLCRWHAQHQSSCRTPADGDNAPRQGVSCPATNVLTTQGDAFTHLKLCFAHAFFHHFLQHTVTRAGGLLLLL